MMIGQGINVLEVLFAATAQVLALYFAILAIIASLMERRIFVPTSSRRTPAIALGALIVTCIGSLVSIVLIQFFPCQDMKWVSVGLSFIFIIGILFIVLSLRDILKRL
jgi:hypothetical protein